MVEAKDKWNNLLYLSLGTNLGDRLQNLISAIDCIKKEVGDVLDVSSIYETEGWGEESLAPFFNLVLKVETQKDALNILAITQKIERQIGRKPKQSKKYENRLIDIDLLFYGDRVIDDSILTLPHPLISKRLFVLVPLEEIASGLIHIVENMTILELLNATSDQTKIIRKNVDLKKFLIP